MMAAITRGSRLSTCHRWRRPQAHRNDLKQAFCLLVKGHVRFDGTKGIALSSVERTAPVCRIVSFTFGRAQWPLPASQPAPAVKETKRTTRRKRTKEKEKVRRERSSCIMSRLVSLPFLIHRRASEACFLLLIWGSDGPT